MLQMQYLHFHKADVAEVCFSPIDWGQDVARTHFVAIENEPQLIVMRLACSEQHVTIEWIGIYVGLDYCRQREQVETHGALCCICGQSQGHQRRCCYTMRLFLSLLSPLFPSSCRSCTISLHCLGVREGICRNVWNCSRGDAFASKRLRFILV